MNPLVHKHWCSEGHQLPGISCILFADGTVTVLNCYSLYDSETNERSIHCSPLCDTTIERMEKYNAACWTLVDEWTNIAYQDGNICGGDGEMGNKGFLAYTDANHHFAWGIFFEHTNPISELKIENRTLIAVNEHHDICIKINLDNLTEIYIVYLN